MTALLGAGPLAVRASRVNPVTKIVAVVGVSLPVLITGDPVVAGALIAGQLVALPLLGLGPHVLVRYAWPFLLALAGVWLANYLASGSVDGLLGVTARLVSLALPGLVFVLSTEPVDLADALVQRWRVPARFAYGALGALRLVPLLAADWATMRRARRARGLSPAANPLRMGPGLLFAVLVAAIRRGTRLAAAMDARGFGATTARSVARRSSVGRLDAVVLVSAAALVAAAVVTGALA